MKNRLYITGISRKQLVFIETLTVFTGIYLAQMVFIQKNEGIYMRIPGK